MSTAAVDGWSGIAEESPISLVVSPETEHRL